MENQKTNPILEAYEQGKKIKHKKWDKDEWIKKQTENHFICDKVEVHLSKGLSLYTNPEDWEIWYEDIEPHQPEPQTEIQKAIKLLIENNYEVYFITKTQIVL
jgi:hypothetical protein